MSALMRHILSLPIDTVVRSKLMCCGFATVEDFKHVTDVEQLKNAANISVLDATTVLKVVKPYLCDEAIKTMPRQGFSELGLGSQLTMKSAEHLLKLNLKAIRHIVSFSSEVDRLLGGGFALGRITEIAGEAGLGKTQFCLQLSVDVQIPPCLGGVGGATVYFDVEGTFFPQRLEQIAKASVEHCHLIASSSGKNDFITSVNKYTLDKVMSNIYLFHCRDSIQLLSATHMMKEFLESHKHVKLLVVDSVAQCVRGDEDMRARKRFLVTLGRMFQDLVALFDIAIVLTNQVSTRIRGCGQSCNIPALGNGWSHVASVKLILHREGSTRYVEQYKSPSCANGYARYEVTAEGIRDHEIEGQQQQKSSTQETSSSRPEEDSSVSFYPITQRTANELMEDFDAEDEALGKGGRTEQHACNSEIQAEQIPDKWLELSQRQLSRRDIDGQHAEYDSPHGLLSPGMLHDRIQTGAGDRNMEDSSEHENYMSPPSPVLSSTRGICSNESKPLGFNSCASGPPSPVLQSSGRLSENMNKTKITKQPVLSNGPNSPILLASSLLYTQSRQCDQCPTPKSPILVKSGLPDCRPRSPVLKRSAWQSPQNSEKSRIRPKSQVSIRDDRTGPPSPVLRPIGNTVVRKHTNTSRSAQSTKEGMSSKCLGSTGEPHSASLLSSGRNHLRAKASATLRATVETMLFSDSPIKAAPKKKRPRLSNDITTKLPTVH